MKVVIYSTQYYEQAFFERLNNSRHELLFKNEPLTAATAADAKGCLAVSVLVHDRVDEPVIKALAGQGIRYLALRAAGYDNVDLNAAARFGITVVRVPAYSPEAVAEHATGLLLSACRKIHRSHQRVKNNNFSLPGLMGTNLFGKTIGVIGTGRIGTAFCRIMAGFGCRVIAYDLQPSSELEGMGVAYVGLDELFEKSDIISLHCPLSESTKHLIDSRALARMKKGVVLVNTARGAIIDTPAIIEALAAGQVGSFATDVYENEAGLFFRDLSGSYVPDEQFLKLSSFSNVLITPHQAYFTTEAVSEIIGTTLQNLTDLEQGAKTSNAVTAAL